MLQTGAIALKFQSRTMMIKITDVREVYGFAMKVDVQGQNLFRWLFMLGQVLIEGSITIVHEIELGQPLIR